MGLVVLRSQSNSLLELLLGQVELARTHEDVSEVCAGGSGTGIEAHRCLEMVVCTFVLGLSRIDEAEKLVNFKALRELGKQLFELGGGGREMAGIVLGNGRLKLTLQIWFLLAENRSDTRKREQKRKGKPNSPQLDAHDSYATTPTSR